MKEEGIELSAAVSRVQDGDGLTNRVEVLCASQHREDE